MGSSLPDFIRLGHPVICSTCGGISLTPRQISREELPATLVCPHCQSTFRILRTTLPKIDPLVYQNVKLNAVMAGSSELFPEKPKILDVLKQQSEVDRIEKPPFYQRTVDIGRLTIEILDNINFLKEDIKQFEANVATFFQGQWKYFDRFSECWDERHIREWIEFPFTVIPVVSEDLLASRYGRFIMAPKFFYPNFGFRVPQANGGMRVFLINQFTRMNFPLETFFCEKFDLPETLDLRVVGNKVIGSSLSLCYKDIPGLAPDSDNTEEIISVYIRDSSRARQWLANHGVVPWSKSPVKKSEMNFDEPQTSITDSEIFTKAWNKFCEYGRAGIFWSDAMASRRFATLVGLMLKGTTVVFIPGQKERIAWDATYGMTGERIISRSNELVFFKNGDPVVWDAVMRTRSAIIDMHGGIDTEILLRMYDYPGRLIVLCPDPILDFHTLNVQASRVHGLCGFGIFENQDFDDLEIKKHFKSSVIALEDSIKNFKARHPDFTSQKMMDRNKK